MGEGDRVGSGNDPGGLKPRPPAHGTVLSVLRHITLGKFFKFLLLIISIQNFRFVHAWFEKEHMMEMLCETGECGCRRHVAFAAWRATSHTWSHTKHMCVCSRLSGSEVQQRSAVLFTLVFYLGISLYLSVYSFQCENSNEWMSF